jgi:DNA-binding FrmR family transcriptional regulator
MEKKCDKSVILANIRRVNGQVLGIEKMVEADRDIEGLLQQVTAATFALRAVAKQLLKDYTDGCFARNSKLDRKKLNKLIEQLFKYI